MLEKNDNRMVMLFGIVMIISVVGVIQGGPPSAAAPTAPTSGKYELQSGQLSLTSTGTENSEKVYNVSLNYTNIVSVSVTLTWTDEANADSRHTNTPDTLGATVKSPEGEEKNGQDTKSQGSVNVKYNFTVTEKTVTQKTSKRGMGGWEVAVNVGTCGDQEPLIPDILGFRTIADSGNAYEVQISFQYYAKAKGGK